MGKILEGIICYIGDILNFEWLNIYILEYYVKLVKELECEGFYILVIKDMVGLLKFKVVYELIGELKLVVDLLIYFYIYDISGNGLLIYK